MQGTQQNGGLAWFRRPAFLIGLASIGLVCCGPEDGGGNTSHVGDAAKPSPRFEPTDPQWRSDAGGPSRDIAVDTDDDETTTDRSPAPVLDAPDTTEADSGVASWDEPTSGGDHSDAPADTDSPVDAEKPDDSGPEPPSEECTSGALRCSGSAIEQCDDAGAWEYADTCPFLCVSGACIGECSPGSRTCEGSVPLRCDDKGFWSAEAECSGVCSDGVCAGSCTPESKDCNGSVPRTCSGEGDWEEEAECPYLCVEGRCAGECDPGERRCSGDEVESCDANGRWKAASSCQYGCSNATCNVCDPGSVTCTGGHARHCDGSGGNYTDEDCTNGCDSGSGCRPPIVETVFTASADNLMIFNTTKPASEDTVYAGSELAVGCTFSVLPYSTEFLCGHSAIDFDVDSLFGRQIHGAYLVLYVESSAATTSSAAAYRLAAAADPWNSGSITWSNQPRYYTSSAKVYGPPRLGDTAWILDVTDIVQGWADGTYQPYGFLLGDTRSSLPSSTLIEVTTFYSTEYGSAPPELSVEYE